MSLLLEDIDTDRRLVFISDQQKVKTRLCFDMICVLMFCFDICTYVLMLIFIQGLVRILEEWSDRLEHRLCFRQC